MGMVIVFFTFGMLHSEIKPMQVTFSCTCDIFEYSWAHPYVKRISYFTSNTSLVRTRSPINRTICFFFHVIITSLSTHENLLLVILGITQNPKSRDIHCNDHGSSPLILCHYEVDFRHPPESMCVAH